MSTVHVSDMPPHIDAEAIERRAQKKAAVGSIHTPKVEPADKYREFPTWLLPEPLESLVAEGAEAIGCDPSFIALPLLSATGSAIGNTARLTVKSGWHVPPIVWSVIVGESGTAKSPAFKVAKAPVVQHHKECLERHRVAVDEHEREMMLYDLKLKAWKKAKSGGDPPEKPEEPKPARCLVSDTTVEALAPILEDTRRGLLLARDELSGWFGSLNQYKGGRGSDEAFWLSAFDGESVTVDRKGEGTRPTFIESALVSITGGIQPAILSRALSTEHRASGMAARFLMASPPRTPRKWSDKEVDVGTRWQVELLFSDLYAIGYADEEGKAHYVGMSEAAKSVWIDYFNRHHDEQCDLSGDLAAAWSKLLGYVPRLALLFHCVEQTTVGASITASISEQTMRAAIGLVDWFKYETRRLYSRLDDNDEQRELRALADWIDRRHDGEATPRQMTQGIRRLKNVDEAETECSRLVKAGLAEWAPVAPSGEKGGRPRRAIRTV